MSETTHTPPPWQMPAWINDGRATISISDSAGVVLCRVEKHGKGFANARLIKAAPDLAEALRWAMKHVENVFALADSNDHEREHLEKARAALAKLEEPNP